MTYTGDTGERFSRLRFDNIGKHDQIANIVERDGWTAFERPLPEFIAAAATRWPGLFIDIGCNTGFYTLIASGAHPRNRVLAFEPVSNIRDIARRNVELNGLSSQVRIAGEAVSDRNGIADLHIPLDDHGMVETSASLNPDFKPSHLRHDPVSVRRLDRAFAASPYRWKKVSIIKIDVEGHEAAVLRGASWIIRLYRPIVFLEVLDRADFAWLNDFTMKNRYVPYRLKPERQAIRAAGLAFDADAFNQALVPAERAETFASSFL